MFLQLNHQKLDVFIVAKSFALECYRFTKSLSADEKFNMVQQVRRAAVSVYLNIAEGCSRKSVTERKRYYKIARESIIEIDAALDISVELEVLQEREFAIFRRIYATNIQHAFKIVGVNIFTFDV